LQGRLEREGELVFEARKLLIEARKVNCSTVEGG
jgi:hypothetical protein